MIRVPIYRIEDNPFQTRETYQVDDLAEAIWKLNEARPDTSGLIQVPPARVILAGQVMNPDDHGGPAACLENEAAIVQLAAGHRRLRAFQQLAGAHPDYATFPVEILPLTNREMADIAWIENEKRQDISPIEKAQALQKAMKEFGWNQAQVGERWDLTQAAVSNLIRLLKLPAEAQAAIRAGLLTERHGRALLAALGKSDGIYRRAAARILPPLVSDQVREAAHAVVTPLPGAHELNFYLTETLPHPIPNCIACEKALTRGQEFYQAHNHDPNMWDRRREIYMHIDCYRAGSGWEPPTIREAEEIVRTSIANNSTVIDGNDFPLDVEIGRSMLPDPAYPVIDPYCTSCPAKEKRGDKTYCLDRNCFNYKRQAWRDFLAMNIQERVQRDYGVTIPVVYDFSGLDLTTSTDKELILAGVCVPGKCERLRLRYYPYKMSSGQRPYDDPNFVWNCNNTGSHKACIKRFEASRQTPEKKQAEAQAKKVQEGYRKQARANLDQAVDRLAAALADGNMMAWRQLAQQMVPDNSGKVIQDEDLSVLRRHVAAGLVRSVAEWISSTASEAGLIVFNNRLNDRLSACGLGPANPAAEIAGKLKQLKIWQDSLVRELPTPDQVRGKLEILADMGKTIYLDETTPDEEMQPLIPRYEAAKATLTALLPLVEAGEVEIEHVSWLVTVPPGDCNFKSHLEETNIPTMHYALAFIPPDGNKVKRETIQARARALSKEDQGEPKEVQLSPCPECGGKVRYFVRLPGKQCSGNICQQCNRVYVGQDFHEAVHKKEAGISREIERNGNGKPPANSPMFCFECHTGTFAYEGERLTCKDCNRSWDNVSSYWAALEARDEEERKVKEFEQKAEQALKLKVEQERLELLESVKDRIEKLQRWLEKEAETATDQQVINRGMAADDLVYDARKVNQNGNAETAKLYNQAEELSWALDQLGTARRRAKATAEKETA